MRELAGHIIVWCLCLTCSVLSSILITLLGEEGAIWSYYGLVTVFYASSVPSSILITSLGQRELVSRIMVRLLCLMLVL